MPSAPKEDQSATPSKFPDIPPPPQAFPSGDYSYILEIVMGMQASVGKLMEAVEALKDQSKEHGSELRQIGKDVHAAKVVASVVGALILLAAGFLGWIVNTYIATHPAK